VIALEGHVELADVLGREARERNGQVEAQGDITAARIGETIQLFVRFLTSLAQQYFGVFQRRRVDGAASSASADNRETL
jgi:hypothetical protein